jgi:hypothetical protein
MKSSNSCTRTRSLSTNDPSSFLTLNVNGPLPLMGILIFNVSPKGTRCSSGSRGSFGGAKNNTQNEII